MSRKESVMAFLEIRAGEGGDDAKLFINDMLRMYQKYCVSHGIQCSLESKMDGIAVLSINGDIRDLMKYETGVHRIQRVPPTETKGRRHSSTITVAIVQERIGKSTLDEKDCDFSFYRGSGPGGQHRNKVETGVRVVHRPTGAEASCCTGRSQYQNRRRAVDMLEAKLTDDAETQASSKTSNERRSQIGLSGRAEKIRTYNFISGRITDHRTGIKADAKSVMNGCLERLWYKERK